MMGEIEKEPWEAACRLKYRFHDDGWDIQMANPNLQMGSPLDGPLFLPLENGASLSQSVQGVFLQF